MPRVVSIKLFHKLIYAYLLCLSLSACQTTAPKRLCTPSDANCQPSSEIPESHSNAHRRAEKPPPNEHRGNILHCRNAGQYVGRVIGDGHCVSLIQKCSDAPNTKLWRAGELVSQTEPPPGTVIATFVKGKYPSKSGYHAAIFISQDQSGIWVWDQWQGKPVHKRLIRYRKNQAAASNSAQDYRVVHVNDK